MRRIIYREDGGVSVITPAPKSRRVIKIDGKEIVPINIDKLPYKLSDLDNKNIPYVLELESEWLERVFNKATPEGADFENVDERTAPLPNRRFRNAWSKGIDGLEMNLPKAKDQVMVELRTVRNQGLKETDGLMAQAVETEMKPIVDLHLFTTETDRLKIYRQKLRNLPQTLSLENMTVADLETKFPKQLTVDEYLGMRDINNARYSKNT